MCVLLSLVDIVVICSVPSVSECPPKRPLPLGQPCECSLFTLHTDPLYCLTAQSSGSPPNCLHHTLDAPDPCFCMFVTPLARVLLVLFRLIGNLWFMPWWLSLNFWNVYASLNKRFVVWYICSVLKLSWSVIIQEVKDEYNELLNLQQPFFWLLIHTLIIHHEHLKIPHISTDQIVIVVLKTMSDLGFCTNIRIKCRFNYRWRL